MMQMNLSMKHKQIHRHGEHTCGCQGSGCGGVMDWEFGISRCKLLYIEWINNKVLLKIEVIKIWQNLANGTRTI